MDTTWEWVDRMDTAWEQLGRMDLWWEQVGRMDSWREQVDLMSNVCSVVVKVKGRSTMKKMKVGYS